MIGARMTMMGGGKPYDAEVEYLQGTSAQWINTGIKGNNKALKIVCRFYVERFDVYWSLFGNYVSEEANVTRFIGSERSDMFYWQINKKGASGTSSFIHNSFYGVVHDFEQCETYVVIDGVKYGTTRSTAGAENNTEIAFFNSRTYAPTQVRDVGLKVYFFKIYDNDTLVRDFIPVRKGNVGYMYDRVSGKLFGNQGTGEFIVGADVEEQAPVSAKSYIQDGLVAMWDGIENTGWGTHDANATVWKSLIGNHTLVPYGVRNVAFNEEDFEIKNINDTYAECDSSDFASLVVSGCTIELCMYRPGWVNPGLEADDYGVLCVADKVGTGNTTNRILCFDTRTGTTTRGVLQYRQAGWQSEASRINPILGLDFGKPIPIFIKCYGDKAVLGKSQGGDTHTSKSFENSYASAKLGLNTYWFGGMFSFATSAKYNFIRVYNRILTDAEIAHNYAVDKERFGL